MNIESYFETQEECDVFNVWAFGDDWMKLDPVRGHFTRWNERHADKLKLEPSGEIIIDVPKMISIWKHGYIVEEIPKDKKQKIGFLRNLVLKYFC